MDKLPKIVMTEIADGDLEAMRVEVNEGFTSGRITKTQLVSWILSEFRTKYFASQIKKIRDAHFDKLAHLKSVVKQMEEAKKNSSTVELDKLLSPLTSASTKDRQRKPTTTDEN